jgi:hypothetical protein
MNRLLLIACCERKNPSLELLPAIERYDGPTFRVLRNYLRADPRHVPGILILSAKFGLIGASELIPDYDCRLTPLAAKRLRSAVLAKLRKELRSSPVNVVGLCLGRDYRQVIKGFETDLPTAIRIELIGGGLGRRLTKLRDWLHNAGETERDKPKSSKGW